MSFKYSDVSLGNRRYRRRHRQRYMPWVWACLAGLAGSLLLVAALQY